MIGGVPNKPAGSSAKARWFQWAHEAIVSFQRANEVPGAKVSRTSRGVFIEPIRSSGDSGNSRIDQYLLIDASAGDYVVCRTLQKSETATPVIGSSDVYIAKPFHLRQSAFDRDALNEDAPGNIGTVDEITYETLVESWDGVTFSSASKFWSYEYKSATFRIATNETDPSPGNWTHENQTIIPRFVQAELDEPEDGPITTDTISPTTIYAVRCSGLGITRPDDPDLPEEEQTQIAIDMLAISDGWAWSKTS